jgi:hypothetical protein
VGSTRRSGAEGLRGGVEKFGWFSKTLYLCTPFAKTGKTVQFERRVGQSVKTPPFHGGMRGSTPLRGTIGNFQGQLGNSLFLFSFHQVVMEFVKKIN